MTGPVRIRSGVPGLDEITGGGLPANSLVVISGDPGSGKTTMCLQYLFMGATQFNENGVFISLEETEEEIVRAASYYGWDLASLIKSGRLKTITVELYDFDKLKNTIEDAVASVNAKRLVIDPGVIFRLYFERELDARKRIMSLGRMLKRLGCTAWITNEIALDAPMSLFGLEEYVADGVVLMYHTKYQDRFVRSIGILKMRGTTFSEKLHPMILTEHGVHIFADKDLFEQAPPAAANAGKGRGG